MRQPFDLKAGQTLDRGCGGHFIAADQVAGYVTVTTNTGRVYQLEQGQVVYPDGGYSSIQVESGADQFVVLLCGYGRFEQVAESVTAVVADQLVVKQIVETVTANIANVVNIRAITETLTAQIDGTVSTAEAAATGLVNTAHTFTAAAEVYNVTANANRRDLGIVCAAENTGTVLINGTPYERGETFALGNYTGAVQLIGSTADKIYITEVIK